MTKQLEERERENLRSHRVRASSPKSLSDFVSKQFSETPYQPKSESYRKLSKPKYDIVNLKCFSNQGKAKTKTQDYKFIMIEESDHPNLF